MLALLQRTGYVKIVVDHQTIVDTGAGMLALLGIEKDDTFEKGQRLMQRMLSYRMFSDAQGHLNLNIAQAQGSLVLVSQFTLAADTAHGNRASFDSAMPSTQAHELYDSLLDYLKHCYDKVYCGQFGADMKVSLLNDGPVSFMLRI